MWQSALVGVLWIATSAIFSTYANGLFLRTFNDAFAHTFVRFALSSGLGLGYAVLTAQPLLKRMPFLIRRMAAPSVLLLVANLLNSMGMLRSGVTVTYVVKSLIPFFTVILCRLRGQRFGTLVYASLLPVCLGVSLASATALDFDWSGFACALGSTVSQTMLNVASRDRIQDLKLSGSDAFLVMATTCTILSIPLLIVSLAQPEGLLRTCLTGRCAGNLPAELTSLSPGMVVVMAAVAYHIEYTLNFLYLALCSSLAFSVTDILRRLGTIVFGSLLFSKPLSALNVAGVLTSLFGVSLYSVVTKLGGAQGDMRKMSKVAIHPDSAEDLGAWTVNYQSVPTTINQSEDDEEGLDSSPDLEPLAKESLPTQFFSLCTENQQLWNTADDSSFGISPQVLCSHSLFSLESFMHRAVTSVPSTPQASKSLRSMRRIRSS